MDVPVDLTMEPSFDRNRRGGCRAALMGARSRRTISWDLRTCDKLFEFQTFRERASEAPEGAKSAVQAPTSRVWSHNRLT